MCRRTFFLGLITLTFLSLSAMAQNGDSPCSCCDEEHQQFDFWIGDWVVYQNAKVAGFNNIVKLKDGCLLRENWKSYGSDYSGTSYNYYDNLDSLWKQVWVDNQGTSLQLSGKYIGNQMILTSKEKTDAAGKRFINRITWTNNSNGTVRQQWEQSEDGGITFSSLFDGLYRKRKLP